MKRVYVAGAYSANNVVDVLSNMRRGFELSAAVKKAGFSPYVPWSDFILFLVEDFEDEKVSMAYYAMSTAWLDVSDAMLVNPVNVEQSKGTQAEIQYAQEHGIPVFYSLDDLKRHFATEV